MEKQTLTRKQKLDLYELIQEKKKRLKMRKTTFKPIPEQLEIMQDDVYERIVTCGNGFGKTAVAVHEAMWKVQGYNPVRDKITRVPATVMVALDKPDKIEQKWKPELDKWYHIDWDKQGKKHGKPYYQELIFPNGSNILFYFHDQVDLTYESIEGDALIFDEPPPKRMYTGLSRGLRKRNTEPFILLVGTLITGAWIRKDLYIPWKRGELEDIKFYKFRADANEANWPKGYKKRFFGRLSEKEKAIRFEGEMGELDGLALAHLFDEDHHVIEAEELDWDFEAYPCLIAVDPHTAKPTHATLMGVDPYGEEYVLDEVKKRCTATKFAETLIKLGWFDFRVMDIVYDSAGNAPSTSGEGFASFGERFNKKLKKEGLIKARGTTFKEKNDEDWIERITSRLAPDEGEPGIKFSSICRGTISDVENVSWTRDKHRDMNKPKLDIDNKDFLACVKYGLAANLTPDRAKRKKIKRLRKQPYVGDRGSDSKRARIIKQGFKRHLR